MVQCCLHCGLDLHGVVFMNERIRELELQAADGTVDPNGPFTAEEFNNFTEKFAELIVKECLNIVSNQTTLDTNEDFREGFSHGLKYAWTDIKKHFGVEE
jgi:hypothetical protein